MNVGEMRARFEDFVDDTVDSIVSVRWFNEAQEVIATEYGIPKETNLAVTAKTWTALPDDFMARLEIYDSLGNPYFDYQIDHFGRIKTQTSDTYILEYLGLPIDLPATNDSAVSALHPILHQLMVIYAASKFFDRESAGDPEESQQAVKYMQQFEMMKQKRIASLRARTEMAHEFK